MHEYNLTNQEQDLAKPAVIHETHSLLNDIYKGNKMWGWEASGQKYKEPSAFEGYCDAWMQK